MEVSYSSFRLKAELIRCCWAVGKVEIAPLLRDFQAEWKSPAVGLFRGASFSTAVLPTNCAKDPYSSSHTSFRSDVHGGACRFPLHLQSAAASGLVKGN